MGGAQRSVTAGASLGLAVSGNRNRVDVHGDVVVGERRREPRSGYLLEVQQLAAPRFEGREAELAAMGAFTTDPAGEGDGYWRRPAPAWSGKTALMAQFGLHQLRDHRHPVPAGRSQQHHRAPIAYRACTAPAHDPLQPLTLLVGRSAHTARLSHRASNSRIGRHRTSKGHDHQLGEPTRSQH